MEEILKQILLEQQTTNNLLEKLIGKRQQPVSWWTHEQEVFILENKDNPNLAELYNSTFTHSRTSTSIRTRLRRLLKVHSSNDDL